jgi:hypothetical protein
MDETKLDPRGKVLVRSQLTGNIFPIDWRAVDSESKRRRKSLQIVDERFTGVRLPEQETVEMRTEREKLAKKVEQLAKEFKTPAPNADEIEAPEAEASEAEIPEAVDYGSLTATQLKAIATERGIEFKANISKAKLIELLTK